MTENHLTETQPPRLAPGGLKLKDAAAYVLISRAELDRFLREGMSE
jgi:hypothetical protein